jgi:hypothetical protein
MAQEVGGGVDDFGWFSLSVLVDECGLGIGVIDVLLICYLVTKRLNGYDQPLVCSCASRINVVTTYKGNEGSMQSNTRISTSNAEARAKYEVL